MRTLLSAVATVLLIATYGDAQAQVGSTAPVASAPAGGDQGASSAPGSAPAAAPTPAPAAAARGALDGRSRELVNPDNNTMVFLYYDLTGLKPPIDSWVEKDTRVLFAPAIEKAPQRKIVSAELESGAASVRGVGVVRLSLNSANLSDYDPTYGEFTVRALAPSSVVSFDALGQKVSLRFGNAQTAQIWRVPADEAQVVRDKVGRLGGDVALDTLLRITGVQPGPGGGTIIADVVKYEMRETRTGATIARVQVVP